jgi:orotate phosphoribosyltransferase-like protein
MTVPWHLTARDLKAQGWKQQAIAAQLNVSQMSVSRVCRHGNNCREKPISNDDVLSLWRKGCDTLFISQLLNCSEATAYNRLARVRG